MLESVMIQLLCWLGQKLPGEHSLWCEAMLAETVEIQATRDRLQWLLGGILVALRTHVRIRVREIATDAEGARLPAEIIVVAAYQCVFSLVLIGVLVCQLPQITERWTDAVPALSIAFFMATVVGVLGFGLFLLDNAARWGTLIFTIAHSLLAWHRISIGLVDPTLPFIRIVFDALIITALVHPASVRRFSHRPVRLNLE